MVIVLALASAACFGSALVVTQFGLRHAPPLTGVTISITATLLIWWLISPLFLDFAGWKSNAFLVFVVVGLFYPAIVMLLTYQSNRVLGPTLTGTVSSTAPLFSVVAAALFLGERFSVPVAIGGLAIVVGLVTLSTKAPMRTAPGWALLIPLSGAALRGVAQMLIKLGLLMWPSPFTAALIGYSASAAVIWSVGASRLPREAKRFASIPWFTGVGALNGTAVLLMYYALNHGSVAVVSPLVATYPLFTMVLSAIFLKQEDLTAKAVCGALLTVAGIVIIVGVPGR